MNFGASSPAIPPPPAPDGDPSRTISVFATDSLGRDLRVYNYSGWHDFRSFVKRGDHYEDRVGGAEPVSAAILRPKVVQLTFGGWEPWEERGLSPWHMDRLMEMIGPERTGDVREFFLIGGINDVRENLSDAGRLNPSDEGFRGEVRHAVGGILTAMIRAADAFPRARVYYLGSGQLSPEPKRGENPEVLAQVGEWLRYDIPTIVRNSLDCHDRLRAIELTYLKVGPEYPSTIPRLNADFAGRVWGDQMPSDCFRSRDHYGHLSRIGSQKVIANVESLFK